MVMLGGVIILYIIALLIGKNIRRMNAATFVFLAIIACVQVAVVLYQLYTIEFPRP